MIGPKPGPLVSRTMGPASLLKSPTNSESEYFLKLSLSGKAIAVGTTTLSHENSGSLYTKFSKGCDIIDGGDAVERNQRPEKYFNRTDFADCGC